MNGNSHSCLGLILRNTNLAIGGLPGLVNSPRMYDRARVQRRVDGRRSRARGARRRRVESSESSRVKFKVEEQSRQRPGVGDGKRTRDVWVFEMQSRLEGRMASIGQLMSKANPGQSDPSPRSQTAKAGSAHSCWSILVTTLCLGEPSLARHWHGLPEKGHATGEGYQPDTDRIFASADGENWNWDGSGGVERSLVQKTPSSSCGN